jgi:type II secretory pathway pseudopilin PulG
MSDQRAWSNAENAVWWPAGLSADQSNLHHQQILNQHHQQQNHMQQQQIQQQIVVQQQQSQAQALNDARSNANTTSVASQQLFSYKMASSFPGGVPTSSASVQSAYDYRLGMGAPQGMTSNPGTQWWYTNAGQNALENLQQQQQQHQQQQQQQQQVSQQQSQSQQHQAQHQTQHNVHTTPVSFQSLSHLSLFLTHPYFIAFYILLRVLYAFFFLHGFI